MFLCGTRALESQRLTVQQDGGIKSVSIADGFGFPVLKQPRPGAVSGGSRRHRLTSPARGVHDARQKKRSHRRVKTDGSS